MNTRELEKKARERAAVLAFQRIVDDCPKGEVLDSESPDFLVHGSSLGIEVCEYFRRDRIGGSPVREQEALRDQVTNRATTICREIGVPETFVWVFFREHRLSTRDVNSSAEAIAKAIQCASPPELDSSSWKIANQGKLPIAIESLIVHKMPGLSETQVTSTDVVWVREIEAEELQQLLSAKEVRLNSYRQKCAKVWLLIVVNGFRRSSMALKPSTNLGLASSFDRVFLLFNFDSVNELSLAAR